MKQVLDPNFWFTQPSIVLSHTDLILGYISAGVAVLGVVLLVIGKFIGNVIHKKLFRKFGNLGLTMGLVGLFWFGLRYENTPIFEQRYWMGLVGLGSIVWLIFILKYLVFNFRPELVENAKEELRRKYLPKK